MNRSQRIHIVADQNIPALPELLGNVGNLSCYTDRTPPPELLRTADALLVRSITQVDETLLQHAPQLKFVATATIGKEHLDSVALAARNIQWTNAPGCNADSVGEYVLAAVLHVLREQNRLNDVLDLDVAIVGAGHTGTATGQRLAALGMNVHYYDPPLAEQGDTRAHAHWQRVLTSDIISLHVPLTHDGLYPTHHLIDIETLQSLHPGQLLINACRGAVVDNQAVVRRCEQGECPTLVFDVFEHEPAIDAAMLPHLAIATPHIAGHSLEGKVGGAHQVTTALCKHFGIAFEMSLSDVLPSVDWRTLGAVSIQRLPDLAELILSLYPIIEDDRRLRVDSVTAAGFDHLRKNYRKDNPRRQLNNQRIACHNAAQVIRFRQLGFNAYQVC
ncbi:4-phosphoerythronate dehydrogenase [Idiomarina fontislapidosi]|uniref:4-phosphoerythronate dehydrogenase n=1 Tax=Idiomarina fontislapidosi TaxID=263723 RepID=UPI001F544AF5|nr:4-phosphoerythronate dehydrogenase [Idiomarina fontislapidosi]